MKKPLMFYFGSEIFLSFGIGMATYAQPFLYKAGHLSDASIGILFAVNSASSGLFALVLGPVADRVGASRMFKLSTLLMGIGFLWMGFATAFWGWFASAVLSGLAAGLLMSTENVVLSSLSQQQEKAGILSRFVSLYMLLIGLGTVTSGWVSAITSYRTAVLAGACIALVAPVIRYFVVANDVKSHRMFKLPSKRIVLMSLYAVLFGTAIGLFRPFATLVLNGHFGMNDELTSAISAATLFMISLGSLLVSPLLRRLRHGRTLLLAFVASILFTLLMAGTGNPWVFAGALLVSTILTSVPGPIVDAMFLDMTPQTDYSQMFGIRVFGNSAGSAIGAYGGGILMSHAVLGGLLTLSSGLLIVSCLYLFWLLARVTKRWRSGVSSSAQRGQFEV
ncbi:MFS transporter [Alicyclobacillus curvatus]|nr:MFS transporter [Alicyclobacillus curvatus]